MLPLPSSVTASPAEIPAVLARVTLVFPEFRLAARGPVTVGVTSGEDVTVMFVTAPAGTSI